MAQAPSLKCVARGASDLSEGFVHLNDDLVQFMLIKFPVGQGTFKRNKYVYVHYVGPNCGAVRRGKWNSQLGSVVSRIGPTSAGIQATSKAELSFEDLVTKMRSVFVSDAGGAFSIAKLKEEYTSRMKEEAKLMVNDDAPQEPTSPIRTRKLAVELGLNAESVLHAVREDMGPFNWCTFEPTPDGKDLKLVEGGSGGLFEMTSQLPDDKVYCGLVRLSFGSGRFRRTKQVFFLWTGTSVGAVKRGKWNSLYASMLGMLSPVNADIRIDGREECEVEKIIQKVQKAFVVDNINLPAAEKKALMPTADEYVAALLEEQKANSKFFSEPEEMPLSPAKKETFDVEETVSLVHKDAGGLVWAIFQLP